MSLQRNPAPDLIRPGLQRDPAAGWWVVEAFIVSGQGKQVAAPVRNAIASNWNMKQTVSTSTDACDALLAAVLAGALLDPGAPNQSNPYQGFRQQANVQATTLVGQGAPDAGLSWWAVLAGESAGSPYAGEVLGIRNEHE